ncbi:choice-of-anchor P family protein [Streptomyces sp. NPDC057575]|uniref:choice-of-anchor P family protein n=1 Tax=unclassified Streptomyces TaxID=2593676 RepID=UPI0036801914
MRRSVRGALLALSATAALTAGSLGPAHAAESAGTTEVTYQGRTFTVPESWEVIDLRDDPETCVRFDRHAVYLGTPGAQQDCPAKVFGRTEALLLEPAEAAPDEARVTENRTSRTYEATVDGISVTAVYGGDRQRIQDVLRSASLPVDDAGSATTAAGPPSVAAVPADATSFQGKGFDKCGAPSTGDMNVWQEASPYSAIGVYIGGVNAGCDITIDSQWVQTQYANDWRFFPIYVGRQADANAGSCGDDGGRKCEVISDPERQGAEEARDAVAQAEGVGFGKGSVLYFNMENYTPGPDTTALVMPFLESWTTTLHELGYVSGVYGSLTSLIADLVKADGSNYLMPDVIDFAKWDTKDTTDDPAIPDHLWADHQRIKQYAGIVTESYGGVEFTIDQNQLDVGDGPKPPVQKDTALAYDGPLSVANGSRAELSATLSEKDGAAPVEGRAVSFALGEGGDSQTCEGTTDAKGVASCPIDSVDQPWVEGATVPLAVTFAGDDDYKASETSAELKLQYVSGRAYGLSAKVPVLLLPLVIAPTPDTGEVRTAGAETVAPACAQGINALVLSADALCAEVVTTTGPSSASATASVTEARIGLAGLPVVGLSGVRATSTSSCTDTTGSTDLTLTIAGTPVEIGDLPNRTIDLGLGAKLVVNEQIESEDGLTVNAVHLTAVGGIDIVVASSATAAHNCA